MTRGRRSKTHALYKEEVLACNKMKKERKEREVSGKNNKLAISSLKERGEITRRYDTFGPARINLVKRSYGCCTAR